MRMHSETEQEQGALNFEARSYFDTTHLDPAPLAEAKTVAQQQNDRVLAIFHRLGRQLTPWEVFDEGVRMGSQWLIGSVRRSMTVLSDGVCPALVKLESQRMGPHGRPSYEWALANSDERQSPERVT